MSDIRSAFAKINLALYITNKLPNGYHSIETIFAPIAWHDTLFFSPAPTIELTCSDASLPTDSTNLCFKAAKLLQETYQVQNGIRIHLEKSIPFGAGLGGGSSDAATVLSYLNHYWKLDVPLAELAALALRLGADVPYFLSMKSLAYAEGIGEKLTDLNCTFPYSLVVVFPNEIVSTAWAYQNLKIAFPRQAPNCREALKNLISTGNKSLLNVFENDFEPLVESAFPIITSLKEKFREHGAIKAMMSGSGSAVFGIFESERCAKACHDFFSTQFPTSYTPPNFVMTKRDFVSS